MQSGCGILGTERRLISGKYDQSVKRIPPFGVEVQKSWSLTSTPLYTLSGHLVLVNEFVEDRRKSVTERWGFESIVAKRRRQSSQQKG
jgi:hypothetical protein